MIKFQSAYLSSFEAASILGLSDARIRQFLAKGILPGEKLGKRIWAIPASEVERFKKTFKKKNSGPKSKRDNA
ncbi:MAG: helix-turn-helix domain-containing protein [Pirellulales bacterium]|nr:helix-turn-helix domain-containing protein [Pirellulales bacterium]